MSKFDFITGEKFLSSLEKDYEELEKCLQIGAWKAVHVMAGSIIEAVLIDYLLTIHYKNKSETEILKMDLGQAILACKEEGILSSKSSDLSSVVRTYRNLIHPGRMIRLDETVDEDGARIAFSLINIIINEVSQQKKKTYGLTAEQLISKMAIDSSVFAILGSLIKNVKENEIERILLKLIPNKILSRLEEIESYDPDYPYEVDMDFSIFPKCFRIIYDHASKDIKTKTTLDFVKIIKEQGEYMVDVYVNYLFRASDMGNIALDDMRIIKSHIIARLEKSLSPTNENSLLDILYGLSKYLEEEDVKVFVDVFIKNIVASPPSHKQKQVLIHYIKNESAQVSEEMKPYIQKRLLEWEQEFYVRRIDTDRNTLKEIIALYSSNNNDDIPF